MKDVVIQSLNVIEKTLKYLVIAILIIMTVVTFYQVVLRYVFQSATIWSEELTIYLHVWLVMLASAIAIRSKRHIRIDFFVNSLGVKGKFIMEMFGLILILLFLLFFFKEGVSIVQSTFNAETYSLKIPMAYPYMALPIGAGLMILFVIEMMIGQIKQFLIDLKVKG